jgi:hypothetical protein
MTASDTTALVLAGVANAVGLAVAIAMWRRHRRRDRVAGSAHPSARAPLTVELVAGDRSRRIALGVPHGAPEVRIDIVSFRRAEPEEAWDSEPLLEPLVVAPGGRTVLTSELAADTETADVVVAWTTRHDRGEVPGSRLFRIPPERDAPRPLPSPFAGLTGVAALLLGTLLVGSAALVAWSVLDPAEDDVFPGSPAPSLPGPAALPSATVPTISPTATAPTPPTSSPAATDQVTPAATAPPATAPPGTSPPATTPPATIPPATTPPATAPPETAPPTDAPAGTAEVRLDGRIAPCRFAEDCLVADFTIAGFDQRPQAYVCEFEDGSRFTFSFDSDGVEGACATGSATASITVEVDGVRSRTVTRADATLP